MWSGPQHVPDCMVLPDGSTVRGHEAIRNQAEQLVGMRGRMTVTTCCVIETGDLAILSNEWTLTAEDESMSAVTAEVAQRQPDGRWLYVIATPTPVRPPMSPPEARPPLSRQGRRSRADAGTSTVIRSVATCPSVPAGPGDVDPGHFDPAGPQAALSPCRRRADEQRG
jgi:hypothetical protein